MFFFFNEPATAEIYTLYLHDDLPISLPRHLNESEIIESVDPLKDVDGFHPENLGRLTAGRPRFVPCTPKGIMRILEYYKIDPSGKHVVVLGRSNIVGRPVSIQIGRAHV